MSLRFHRRNSIQSEGFLAGIRSGVTDLTKVATVVHGTTVGTNALLERKGAKTGIITNSGFRDTLEMRRRDRPRTWGLWGQFDPVVPRDRRLEVQERTLADGTIHTEVDIDEVKAQSHILLDMGTQSVAVVFINAYANPANEMAALAAVREIWPNDHVVASHEILPEIGSLNGPRQLLSTPTYSRPLAPIFTAWTRPCGTTASVAKC